MEMPRYVLFRRARLDFTALRVRCFACRAQDKTPKAVVSLERAAVGSPSNIGGLEEEFCFSLHTPAREYMFVAESHAEMVAWQQALNENIKEKIDDALSQIAAAAARAEYDEKQRRKAEQEKASQDKKEQKVAEQARKVQSKEDARCRQAIDDTVKLRSQLVALDSDCNAVESRFVELTRYVEKSILLQTLDQLFFAGV